LKTTGWHDAVRRTYATYRKGTLGRIVGSIPLVDGVPDIANASIQNDLAEAKQLCNDVNDIVTAFNSIEARLNDCYLVDDPLPQKVQVQGTETIRALWNKWKDSGILNKPAFKYAFATPKQELLTGIAELDTISRADGPGVLVDRALNIRSSKEVVYATWTRLGKLSDPKWPSEMSDFDNERKIQERLKTGFAKIKELDRKRKLLDTLTEGSAKRELVFKRSKINRYETIITTNNSSDKVLSAFGDLPQPGNSIEDVNEFETLAKDLSEFVSDSKWPKQYRLDLAEKDPIYEKPAFARTDYRYWLNKIKDYRKLTPDSGLREFEDLAKYLETHIPIPPAKASHREGAEQCPLDFKRLVPRIVRIRNFELIEKNGADIKRDVDEAIPELQALVGRVLAATEDAAEFRQRYTKVVSIATSNEINAKWIEARSGLFGKYPPETLENNPTLDTEFRQKVTALEQRLSQLDEEFQRDLPTTVPGIDLKATGWHDQVRMSYDNCRRDTIKRIVDQIPSAGGVPDPNSFKKELDAAKQLCNDVSAMVTAFNTIESQLDLCHLLSDPLP